MKINTCRHCARSFKGRRKGGYCSDQCRYQAWKETATPCYYCGCPADTIDHCPPQAVRPILIEQGARRWPFVEVSACKECNSALGAKTLWTLGERKDFIKKWLKRKYGKYLRSEWHEYEMEDLGYNLRSMLQAYAALGELTRQRLKW